MSLKINQCKTIKSEYMCVQFYEESSFEKSSEFYKNIFPNIFSNIKLTNSFWEVRKRFWNQERQSNFVSILRNFVVPTRSVWYVILFRETGVVHRITFSFNCFFFYLFRLLNLFLI